MKPIANIQVANDVGAVNSLRTTAQHDKVEALTAVAKQFEAIMLQQLLKTSRETTWDDGFGDDAPGTGSMDSYREWRDDQFAQTLSAKGSMGFADMLIKQLSPSIVKPVNKAASQDATVDSASIKQPVTSTESGMANMTGWWKVPAADIPQVPQVKSEVSLPSTEEALLLRKLLQQKTDVKIANS